MSRLALAALSLALAASPVLVDLPGTWTLQRLGYGTRARSVPAQSGFAFRWRAPAGTRQGAHGLWYGVRVHARILLDTHRTTFEAAGEVVTSGGRVGICDSVVVEQRFAGESYVFAWTSMNRSLEVAGAAEQPVLLVRETTPCSRYAVRGGVNETHFAARGFGEHARLVVLPDSGITLDRISPPPAQPPPALVLGVAPPTALQAGQTATLTARVAGAGTPLEGGSISVRVPPGPLRIVGAARKTLPHRRAAVPVAVVFRVRALAAGNSWILVAAGAERRLVLVTIH